MRESFGVGEIAIIAKSLHGRSTGRECTITGPLTNRWINWPDGPRYELCYAVEFEGVQYHSPPDWLSKKPPDRDDLTIVSWNSVPWWPEQLVRELS